MVDVQRAVVQGGEEAAGRGAKPDSRVDGDARRSPSTTERRRTSTSTRSPSIRRSEIAAVYDARGALFAGYSRGRGRPSRPLSKDRLAAVDGDQLVVTAPVTAGQRPRSAPCTCRRPSIRFRGGSSATASWPARRDGVADFRAARRRAGPARRCQRATAQDRALDLAAANENLRSQIEQRENAEAALRQAQKMEAVGQLTGGIAHDFNNLLHGDHRQPRDPAAPQLVADDDRARIQRSASMPRAAPSAPPTLTQRLLAFSRRQPLEPKPIDVNRLVAGMSELLRRTLGEPISDRDRAGRRPVAASRPIPTSSRTRCSTSPSTPATRCRAAAS